MAQLASKMEISADELHDAYKFSKLRKIGVGYLQAIATPSILRALHNVAAARRKAQINNSANAHQEAA